MANRPIGPCELIAFGWYIDEHSGHEVRHWPSDGNFGEHGYSSCEWRKWDNETAQFGEPFIPETGTSYRTPQLGAFPPDFRTRPIRYDLDLDGEGFKWPKGKGPRNSASPRSHAERRQRADDREATHEQRLAELGAAIADKDFS